MKMGRVMELKHRWQIIPLAMLAVGVLIALLCLALSGAALGYWWGGLIVASLLIVGSGFWFRKQLSDVDNDRIALEKEVEGKWRIFNDEREDFRKTQAETRTRIETLASSLEKREQAFANQLVTYHEWMEFPKPLDLNEHRPPLSDDELTNLAKKDRELIVLLEAESKILFEKILANDYVVEERLEPSLILADAYELVQKVVDIYQPGVEKPFLETSMAQVLRAASRACIQFMVVLDELPLDVKEHNLRSMYSYVQQSVTYYGYYKKVEPFWPYLNSAYYLGRFAFGANPITLGAWWVISTLGARGARTLATKVVHQQALLFLNNIVRVIGFETASIYGDDFRHRDANWIYATELTELMQLFPPTQNSLVHALREVGVLQLRNEYDRVFLYRALAANKSADPDQYRAHSVLSTTERTAVAERLERFVEAFLRNQPGDELQVWRKAVEQRLGVQLGANTKTPKSSGQQREEGLRSLASFLLSIKEFEPEDLPPKLTETKLWSSLESSAQEELLASLNENPPFFFEQPDIEPQSAIAEEYLNDFAKMAVHLNPPDVRAEDTFLESAAWLRVEDTAANKRLADEYHALLLRLAPADSIKTKPPLPVSRFAFELVGEGKLEFLYGNVMLEWETEEVDYSFPTYLLGVDEKIVVFAIQPTPRVVWESTTATVKFQRIRGVLSSSCQLSGGNWLDDSLPEPDRIQVSGVAMTKYQHFFAPLLGND